MKKVNYYSASEYVTRRAGCLHSSYRIPGGRYIISENEVRSMLPYITPEELVTGLDIIPVSKQEAERLIKEGGYHIGPEEITTNEEATQPAVEEESSSSSEETEEATEEENNENAEEE